MIATGKNPSHGAHQDMAGATWHKQVFLDAAGAVLHSLTRENCDCSITSAMLVDYYFSVSSIYSEKKFSGLSCSVVCVNIHSSKVTTLLFLFIYVVYTPALLGSRAASSMQMIICWIAIIWKEEGCWKPSVQVPKKLLVSSCLRQVTWVFP